MTPDNVPFVAIIVLTWNQRDLTLDCLASLTKMEYPSDRLQVIVVDNASQDGTVAAIRERFPTVSTCENIENLGFAEGNNVGIRLALLGPAKYLMLLNNDTIVDPHMLSTLIGAAESDSTVGVVTPKIYYYDEPNRIWCAGAAIEWQTAGSIRLQAENIDNEVNDIQRDVDFASGCAMCWKRQAIEQIGEIDSRFFIYYEETDWCVRARAASWRIMYVPRSRMWHRVSAAMGTASPATDYYMARNSLLFLAKNLNRWRRVASMACVIARSLRTIAAYTVSSYGSARTPNRNARILALRDALLGRWGRMGSDVAAVCYARKP